MRTTGVVKVEVTIDENGEVSQFEKTSGPTTLQNAAKDAIKKWNSNLSPATASRSKRRVL